MTNNNKKYFENLDAIRFVLAMMVLLGHSMFGATLNHILPNTEYFHDIIHAVSNGSQAVSFFFVLSGFLITYLLVQEKEKEKTINIKNFYIRRLLRIWPVYYFVVVFGYWIYPFLKSLVGWETTIASIWWVDALFLGNFNSLYVHANNLIGLHPMMVGITWSVSIEEQFYLVWPIVFLLNKKYLPFVLILCILGSLLFSYYNPALSYYHTLSRMMDLALGGLFGLSAFYSTSFINFFKNLSKSIIFIIYTIGLLYYTFGSHLSISFGSQFIMCVFYAFIICEQNYAENSLFKFGRWKFGSKQGKYTYGLYMLHPIGIQVAVVLYKLIGINNADNFLYGSGYVIISLVVSYMLAYLSYHYFESYFLGLKNKF
jgi:peptidoglycan/LPS O-acetylase OafA/YrhL